MTSGGVCFELPGRGGIHFDCIRAYAIVNLAKINQASERQEVTVADGYHEGLPKLNAFLTDGTFSLPATPARNWMEISSRTDKKCREGSEEGLVTCDPINFAIYRNFETEDVMDQDLQLTVDDAEMPFRVYGWVDTTKGLGYPTYYAESTNDLRTIKLVSKAAIDDYSKDPETNTQVVEPVVIEDPRVKDILP